MREFPLPGEWMEFGARFGNDGRLYLAEWRQGFNVHQLRAMFFTCQEVGALRIELRQARADQARQLIEFERLARERAFYRHQLVLESRLGMCLARITLPD